MILLVSACSVLWIYAPLLNPTLRLDPFGYSLCHLLRRNRYLRPLRSFAPEKIRGFRVRRGCNSPHPQLAKSSLWATCLPQMSAPLPSAPHHNRRASKALSVVGNPRDQCAAKTCSRSSTRLCSPRRGVYRPEGCMEVRNMEVSRGKSSHLHLLGGLQFGGRGCGGPWQRRTGCAPLRAPSAVPDRVKPSFRLPPVRDCVFGSSPKLENRLRSQTSNETYERTFSEGRGPSPPVSKAGLHARVCWGT